MMKSIYDLLLEDIIIQFSTSQKDYLTNVLKKYEFLKINNPHVKIRDRFLNSNNDFEYKIGETLSYLRKMRNKADYDKYASKKYFFKNLDKVKLESEDAINNLNILRRNYEYHW